MRLPPTVLVLGDEQQALEQVCTEIDRCLQQSDIPHVAVSSHAVSPESVEQILTEVDLRAQDPLIVFSVVVPVYNEESNIALLYDRLTAVMAGLGEPYELVFVDDGCQDRSPQMLKALHDQDPNVRLIRLSRNFGHQRAICAGLEFAHGQAVIVMDADLQDPPEVLPQFIAEWERGFEVVYAIREKRQEGFVKRSLYHLFYLILRSVSRVDLPLEAGDFCLMDRRVVEELNALPERNRFVRGLRSWVGFRQVGFGYEREARYAGKTKYSFRKLMSLALDGLISFSYLPLRLAMILGFTASAASLLAAFYYLFRALVGAGLNPPGFATQVILISFLGGVQLITIGVIGEYVGHILDEVKQRPTYIIRRIY